MNSCWNPSLLLLPLFLLILLVHWLQISLPWLPGVSYDQLSAMRNELRIRDEPGYHLPTHWIETSGCLHLPPSPGQMSRCALWSSVEGGQLTYINMAALTLVLMDSQAEFPRRKPFFLPAIGCISFSCIQLEYQPKLGITVYFKRLNLGKHNKMKLMVREGGWRQPILSIQQCCSHWKGHG